MKLNVLLLGAIFCMAACGESKENEKRESTGVNAVPTKNYDIDEIATSDIVFSSLDTANKVKRIIYTEQGKTYYSIVTGHNEHNAPVLLLPNKDNGGDTYKYFIASGVDSGMQLYIDKFSGTFESINETGGSVYKTPLDISAP